MRLAQLMQQTNSLRSLIQDPPAKRPRPDLRWAVAGVVVFGVVTLGLVIDFLPSRGVDTRGPVAAAAGDAFSALRPDPSPPLVTEEDPGAPPDGDPHEGPAKQLFAEVAKDLRAKNYDAALIKLNRAQSWARRIPKSYYLVARALEGKGDHETARDFYRATIDRDPTFSDAYWGFATTSESLQDLPSALGAMRSFLHTVPDADPQRLRIAQARSAIWEWEAQLGRGPWGPTKGILPGLKPEQVRRDGRGVATMMPIKGATNPDGSTRFEIKHSEKIEMFKK